MCTSFTGDLWVRRVEPVLLDEDVERMVESSLAPLRMIVPNRRDALSSSMMVISSGLVVSLYSLRTWAISSKDIGYDDMSDG